MSELFRSGRGGAGNHHPKGDVEKVSNPEDVESQAQVDSSSTSINDLTRTVSASNPPPEYLHTGRGGAGNWVQPKELQSQGLTQDPSLSGQDASKRTIGSSKPTYKGGRGGAGNYGSSEKDEKERREQEQKKRDQVEKAVERDVETGLARPERTYGGQGGSWEMGDVNGQDK